LEGVAAPACYLITAIATPATNAKITGTMHPQQSPPIFRCLPERVHGMPVARLIRDLAAEIPASRFHEKPPRFGTCFPSLCYEPSPSCQSLVNSSHITVGPISPNRR